MAQQHPDALTYRRTADAFRAGDLETVETMIAPEVVWHVPGEHRMAGVLQGRAAVLDWLARVPSGFWLREDDVFASDDHVCAISTMGARRDGLDVQTRVISIFRYRGGRQIERWFYPEDGAAWNAIFGGEAGATGLQPELWIVEASRAVAFYEHAFGATTLHLVGQGDDIVAQLAAGEAVFWVAAASPANGRFDPRAIHGATGRILLVVDDPTEFARRAIEAGATETSPVAAEHGWLVGRLTDPFGHEWEIGRPIIPWPPG